jgi:hypothetical protein
VPDGYIVQSHSLTLSSLPQHLVAAGGYITDILHRIRVVSTSRSQRQTLMRFFYGKIVELLFDPVRTQWESYTPFLDYTTQLGKAMLRRRHLLEDLAAKKWSMLLPPNFQFP